VLLDIGLPGMDGYEVARRLRQHPELKEVRLIAVTGYRRESDLQLSHESASMVGFMARHGGHHEAQKSTSTGSLAWITSFFQLNSCRSIGILTWRHPSGLF
jgi:CheY-like chemotaxis protein